MLAHMSNQEFKITGQRIKIARERLGISQTDLANVLGQKQQAVDRWEQGSIDIRGSSIRRLAAALEVSTDYLLGTSDDPSDNAERAGLSKEQRQVLWFMDNGLIMEAVKALTDLPQRGDLR